MLFADVEGVGDTKVVAVAVTVTVLPEPPVELAVAELIATEGEIAVLDELSPSPPSQSPSSFGSFATTELVVSFPVMPP